MTDGREEHHGRHDRRQSAAGGNERRVRDDPGGAHDRRADARADGHQGGGIGGCQEDVACQQGRRSCAPRTERREQPGAVDDSTGLEWLICGPGFPQCPAGIPAEVDQGDRAAIVRQDLSNRGARRVRSGVRNLHGPSLVLGSVPTGGVGSDEVDPFCSRSRCLPVTATSAWSQ